MHQRPSGRFALPSDTGGDASHLPPCWSIRVQLGLFVALQLLVILTVAQGLSGDEGIYALAGLRLLDGAPDEFSSWINGSRYLWPPLSGLAWRVGGVLFARLVALAFAVVAIAAAAHTTRRLLGDRAARWSTFALVTSGPLFALAHLAVYDLPALAAFALALAAVVEYRLTLQRRWLIVCGLLMGLSVIAKYGYVFMLPVPLALGVADAPSRRRWVAMGQVMILSGVVVAAHDLLVLGHLLPRSYQSYVATASGTGFSRSLVLAEQLYYVVPLLIAAVGVVTMPRRRSAEHWILAGALLIWPVFHLVTGNPTSANKHTVAGLVAAAPLLGLGMAQVVARWRPVLVGVILWGSVQWVTHEYSWGDLTATGAYLCANAPEDAMIYPTTGAFRLWPVLYDCGRVRMPRAAAFDVLEQGAAIPPDADWLVTVERDGAVDTVVPGTAPFVAVAHFSSRFVGASDGVPFGWHHFVYHIFRRRRALAVPADAAR
ncbi:MAG: glycosyltransferase family 39 protein [Gemmatimonadaceae bacterium]